MKKKIYTLICCLAGALTFSSCSDWFDISPKTDVKAEDMFETESGFMSALAGMYVSMTEEAVYGRDLSYGLVDQLAQLYDMLPASGYSTDRNDLYSYTEDERGFQVKSRLAAAWMKSYNIIANANNLLRWLDQNGERVLMEETRNMMYGEAYAMRAYLHFDLLRGWGPMFYATQGDVECIPYRKVADTSKQPLLSARKVVENILADLTLAEQYLLDEKGTSLKDSDRRCRFNYYAVKALQARVYCYIGDDTNAFNCADEVISSCGLSLKSDNQADPVLYDEAICAVNLYQMDNAIIDYFAEGPTGLESKYHSSMDKFKALFEASGSSGDADIRARSGAMYLYTSVFKVISRKYIKNDNAVIPLIRLPEMYYIKCECAPLAESAQYINTVRNKRGFTTSQGYTAFADDATRMAALDLEYRKEFYAEGQYFYFLKRNGITELVYDSEIALSEERFVFPLPDAEKEYGWTSGEGSEVAE